MSTFKGVVAEFPDIRIDFFRLSSGTLPPLACFLSHVHSDHLAGLDSLKSPFVYCSPATREILLRLEKYPHRMNFALKILESRKQTYKHLDKILKPIPLETPTKIELAPGNVITVTLFDANHCPGAVMFLIENDEKSILYTGDIRSEPSFVTNLRRNPYLIEYTGGIKTLDCIYLDTSNTENISFPSKAEGLTELIQKVSKYPSDTIFHVSSWTYGYEEVWMALSKIHVDRYKMRIYKSLVGNGASPTGPFISYEGPILAGYQCGNTKQDGCLTEDSNVRLHSCEKGLHCPVISNSAKVVWITPIVSRTRNGEDIEEAGIGGGGGDLVQRPELELSSTADIEEFLGLLGGMDYPTKDKLRQRLLAVLLSSRMAISLEDLGLSGLDRDQNEMSLESFAEMISNSASSNGLIKKSFAAKCSLDLPRKINFPYSRHSSYPELCDLVGAFSPKDVFPCTVDESEWHEGISIRTHFGRHCSTSKFRHDVEMRQLQAQVKVRAASIQTHTTESSDEKDSSITAEPAKTSVEIKRDHQGRLRFFKRSADQAEIDSPSSTSHKSPPSEIVATSPGSQSQNLRRKTILGHLAEARIAKRPRLAQTDGPASSPLRPKTGTQSGHQDEPIELDSSSISAGSNAEPGTPTSSDEEADLAGDEIKAQLRYLKHQTFFDHRDNVQRCLHCEHELNSLMGHCEQCEIVDEHDERIPPYYEVLDPEMGPRPEMAFNEYDDDLMDEEDRLRYVGDYLDDDSSAYDSKDESDFPVEEYDEADSFIDTTPDKSSDEDEESDHDEEEDSTDWYQKFKDLEANHNNVVATNQTLNQQHRVVVEAFMQTEEKYYTLLDDMGIPHTSDEDDDDDDEELEEDIDEEGNILVNPSLQAPAVHELVISHAEENSQNSELSQGRIRARVEAYEAVMGDAQGWQHVGLASVGQNHSEAEVEL